MARNNQKPAQELCVSVPVFVTDRKEIGNLFECTYQSLIDELKATLEAYNKRCKDHGTHLLLQKRNKTYSIEVRTIDFEQVDIGDRPALLLNASVYTSGKLGEHLKEDEIVTVEKGDRVGDRTSYFLLLPQIATGQSKYYNWIALVYNDPTRHAEEIIATLKAIMNDILKRPIKNIKLPELMKRLEEDTPRITLNLYSVDYNDNELNDKFKAYSIETKSIVRHEFKFANMPLEEIDKLIKEKFDNKFRRKIIKFFVGQKEYKISQEMANFKDGVNLLVEQFFNFEVAVTPAQLAYVHDREFMLDIMNKTLDKYLTNGEL